jgi:Zn-dependent protease
MINAWNLGTVGGIKLRVHWTFFLLPIWIYVTSIVGGRGVSAAVISVLFVLAIFGCVLLHELGHAFAARQFGIGTRDITLLPIGGVAALEKIPRHPLQELWIAVAGPLVNVVIAAVLFMAISLNPAPGVSLASQFFAQLALANVVLVLFNLIPAFPMDGGRVLRSILAMFMDYAAATNAAATVGQFCAIGLGLLGLFSGQLMLLLVAGFVFLAAKAENMQVAAEASRFSYQPGNESSTVEMPLPQGSPEGIWYRDEESVPSSLSISSAAAWLARQHRDYCAVVESGRVIGRITKSQLVAAIYRGLGRLPVGALVVS